MFTSQDYIDYKCGADGLGRLEYLQALVTEYQDTSKDGNKEQVLANLANFAYDPINYGHFKKLNVADLFMDALAEDSEKQVEFGIGGLCNCCLDTEIKQQVIEHDGVALVINCLSSTNEETVLSAITTLMSLVTPGTIQESVEASKSSNTDSVSSVKDESDKAKYRILHIFLQSFIITMVVCTLLVLVFVAYKVTRERREAECQHQGNHFQNADANIVQEVYTGEPSSTAVQGGIHEGTSQKDSSQVVNIVVNNLPDVEAAKHFSLNRKL